MTQVNVSPQVSVGEKLRASVQVTTRVPKQTRSLIHYLSILDLSIYIESARIRKHQLQRGRFGVTGGLNPFSLSQPLSYKMPDEIGIGKHVLEIEASVKLIPTSTVFGGDKGRSKEPYYAGRQTHTASFEVVRATDADQSVGRRSPELDEWFVSHTRAAPLRYHEDPDETGSYRLILSVAMDEGRPVPITQKFLLFIDGGCIETSTFTTPAEGYHTTKHNTTQLASAPAEATADLYVLPTGEMWRLNEPPDSGWGGVIAFRSLPVREMKFRADGAHDVIANRSEFVNGELISDAEAAVIIKKCRANKIETLP